MNIPKSYSSPFVISDRPISHLEQALENNLWQFKTQENIEKLLDVLVNQLQLIQSDIVATQRGLSIETGTGWTLDLVGKSLQVYRGEGQDDESFRRSIVEFIVFSSSQGTLKDLLSCISLLVEEGTLVSQIEAYPAATVTQVPFESLIDISDPLTKMQSANSAGVKASIHVFPEAETAIFSFDGTSGSFSSTGYPTLNGAMAANLTTQTGEFFPFSLDGVTQFDSKGLDASDFIVDERKGNFVANETFIDVTGDGIPDVLSSKCIEAINYTDT